MSKLNVTCKDNINLIVKDHSMIDTCTWEQIFSTFKDGMHSKQLHMLCHKSTPPAAAPGGLRCSMHWNNCVYAAIDA
jgi:hypothetical protein